MFSDRLVTVVIASCLAWMSSGVQSSDDFEFDEAGTTPQPSSGVKTWLLDPDNELCKLLRCGAAEVCLLQDRYTAVCVSRAEVARSGDKVVPFNKMAAVDLKSFQSMNLSEDDEDDYMDDTDEEDDDEDYYSDTGSEGGETEAEAEDKDSSAEESPMNDAPASPLLDRQPFASSKQCGGCPLSRPVFLCGSDNRTYSSTCRLHFHNCIHSASVAIACKGFCPCNEHKSPRRPKSPLNGKGRSGQRKQDALLRNTIPHGPDRPPLSFLSKHAKTARAKAATHGDSMNKSKKNSIWAPNECGGESLTLMGNRILDWFSVIMADSSKTSRRNKAPRWCKREVAWMLGHLDTDGSGLLERPELYRLQHQDRERCMRPFFDRCDLDRDGLLSAREWCKCFDQSERPCAALRSASLGQGSYIPECDSEGWYRAVQCRAALCWCVDRHGAELPFTRTHGTPDCGTAALTDVTANKKSTKAMLRIDDEDEKEATLLEGSADLPLEI